MKPLLSLAAVILAAAGCGPKGPPVETPEQIALSRATSKMTFNHSLSLEPPIRDYIAYGGLSPEVNPNDYSVTLKDTFAQLPREDQKKITDLMFAKWVTITKKSKVSDKPVKMIFRGTNGGTYAEYPQRKN